MITKKEIIKRICDDSQLNQADVKTIVQGTLDTIVESLIAHERIELRNFGVFEVKRREPRKARNPKTGKEVFLEARHVVAFKPGKNVQQLVAQKKAKPKE